MTDHDVVDGLREPDVVIRPGEPTELVYARVTTKIWDGGEDRALLLCQDIAQRRNHDLVVRIESNPFKTLLVDPQGNIHSIDEDEHATLIKGRKNRKVGTSAGSVGITTVYVLIALSMFACLALLAAFGYALLRTPSANSYLGESVEQRQSAEHSEEIAEEVEKSEIRNQIRKGLEEQAAAEAKRKEEEQAAAEAKRKEAAAAKEREEQAAAADKAKPAPRSSAPARPAPRPRSSAPPAPKAKPKPAPSGNNSSGFRGFRTRVGTTGNRSVNVTVTGKGSGSATITVTVGSQTKSVTVSGTGSQTVTFTGLPPGRVSWSTRSQGVVQNGSVAVP